MAKISKIIFDCFGTLIDTGSTSLNATRTILKNVGCDADAEKFYSEWKATKKKMMHSGPFFTEKEYFRLSLEKMFVRYNIIADASQEIKPMTDILFGVRCPFPDTLPALRMLDNMGIDYAIGSTTDTDSLMHFLEINDMSFRYIFTSEDMRIYKPFPEFYQTIINKTGWKTDDCLFVGDSLVDDVQGPQSVGMKAALIDRKGKYSVSSDIKPDYIIHSLIELKEIL